MKKAILPVIFILLIASPRMVKCWENSGICDAITWEQELNKINWLVLKASSLNVINGLYLNTYQAGKLMHLAREIESSYVYLSSSETCDCSELSDIYMTYRNLLNYLQHRKPLPKALRNEVTQARLKQAELVKKTVLGSQKPGYMANNCLQCHAMPHQFPKGNIEREQAGFISVEDRKKIDRAHIEGIFGSVAAKKLWDLKADVDRILTNNQKFILQDFRCCLLPPDSPSDAPNLGQVFVTNKWNNYLKDIRSLSQEQWRDFRPLYFVPISDYIEATLPAIRKKDKREMLDNISKIIEESRSLDLVDYELQKDSLCMRLKRQLSVDHLSGESDRLDEERQFITAMFLLYPGSAEVYEEIIKKGEHKTQLGYRLKQD